MKKILLLALMALPLSLHAQNQEATVVETSAAAPVIKKEVKFGSKEVDELTTVFGVDDKNLGDYGLYTKDKKFIIYEPDSNLRDGEKIPVVEDIYEYFLREVRPYVEDAWIDLPSTKIGCEISFNKYFYKPAALRTLEENQSDIVALNEQSKGFIQSLLNK